jgi:DNA-binding response OmpR family regulator
MSNLILVISDDRNVHGQLRLALTETASRCQLECVASREEIPPAHRPALILLDLMLSREPAFEVLKWLRSQQRYQHTPVFVLGSEIVEHDVNEAYSLGANSCLLMRSIGDGFGQIAQGIATYASLIPSPAQPS